jgi:hypothetical protein
MNAPQTLKRARLELDAVLFALAGLALAVLVVAAAT